MDAYSVRSPVAMIVFNRPDLTRKVLEQVRRVKPQKLYVIADGPRAGWKNDAEQCAETRELFEGLDWGCQVHKNYSDVNLGCGMRPASGISWVFENEEQAIILEDDCLPDTSFFQYCDSLLEKYANDTRVMLISGTNIFGTYECAGYDYLFSLFGGIHGWASWRRAWRFFDYDIAMWEDDHLKSMVRQLLADRMIYMQRARTYDMLVGTQTRKSAWDYQWGLARLSQSGMAIVPRMNLISNLGFGDQATHTTSTNHSCAGLPTGTINAPLRHPPYVVADRDYDNDYFFTLNSRLSILVMYLKHRLSGFLRLGRN